MAHLIVEGNTLGQKHQNYNKLVNETIKNNAIKSITTINYEEPDLDNLFKIDIACSYRDVDYILTVFKCEDMLYVSRAIKQSTWLITDQQYSHIINPEYLYNHLYAEMTSKAFNKLILHVRLNLKAEKRVEQFFNYYEQKDFQTALKWLLHCSIPFTENIVQKYADHDIPQKLWTRLCEKSITFLKIYCQYSKSYDRVKIYPANFIFSKNFIDFMNIVDENNESNVNNILFGRKLTKKIMKNCPDKIMNNLEKHVNVLNVRTFARCLKRQEVKDFISIYIKNKKMSWWFNPYNINYFLNRLPVEERLGFIKIKFIEQECDDINLEDWTWRDVVARCPPIRHNLSLSKNMYSWYVHAPFSQAFDDLKQFIRNESDPDERTWILKIMLKCADGNMENVRVLLKYYREKHINEPLKFKINFVNHLLTNTEAYRYDKESWEYLNGIFKSMDVYSKSELKLTLCVNCIIVYNLIHGEDIPEVVKNKFVYENFGDQNKFSKEEKDKIFIYLYKYMISKITNASINESDFNATVDTIHKILILIKDWNKDLQDFPVVVEKIKHLCSIKKDNSWSTDLSKIYNIEKTWKKIFLPESIILSPKQDTYINALKHDPDLFEKHKTEINKCLNENEAFDRFLKKHRIYWSQIELFKTTYLKNLEQKSTHNFALKGICTLLPQKELLNFIKKHVPMDAKIDWNQPDNTELSIRKHIARYLYLARPQPSLDVALFYAKGDYLQYVLPSLNALLYNLSSSNINKYREELLNTSETLQKLSIRIAFSKLKFEEFKIIYLEIWKSNNNHQSIRSEIFNQTYIKLCREKDKSAILEIWGLLSVFIDSLSFEEDKKIFLTLSKTDEVPFSVRAAFWMKSYQFLKMLPAKANCRSFIDNLNNQMIDVIEFLDSDLMSKIFLENINKNSGFNRPQHIALFLLSTQSETVQSERYEKVLLPIIDLAANQQDKQTESAFYVWYNLRETLEYLCYEFGDLVIRKRMVFPIALYTAILNKLEICLSVKEHYMILTYMKLSLAYIKIIYELKITKKISICPNSEDVVEDESDEWHYLNTHAAPIFGELCVGFLKEDIAKYFPSIYIIFADVLNDILSHFGYNEINKLRVLQNFISCESFIQGHLLVLKIIPQYLYKRDEKALRAEVLKVIRAHPSEEVRMQYCLFLRNDKNVRDIWPRP